MNFGAKLVWLETRKPLKRFLKIGPYCNPKLKLGENETLARGSNRLLKN
jgi:hypothetical protein